MEVTNIQEAQDFFLSNSSGSVICVNGDRKKECECYPEAEEFFKTPQA